MTAAVAATIDSEQVEVPRLKAGPRPRGCRRSVEVAELIVESLLERGVDGRRLQRRGARAVGAAATSARAMPPTTTTPARPAAYGKSHASRLNPRSIGSASTSWLPYFVTKY